MASDPGTGGTYREDDILGIGRPAAYASPITPVASLEALARLHLARYRDLPEGEDDETLDVATGCLAAILVHDPSAMPADLADLIEADDIGEALDDILVTWLDRALTALAGGPADEVTAERWLLRGLLLGGPGGENRFAFLGNLAMLDRRRYERTADRAWLDSAVSRARDALSAAPTAREVRAGLFTNLGLVLRSVFDATGDLDALAEGVLRCRQALEEVAHSTEADPDDVILYRVNLVGALMGQHGQTGDPACLSEAVELATDTLAICPRRHSARPSLLTNLALGLSRRSDPRAVELAREAVATATVIDQRIRHRTNLAVVLRRRYDETGQVDCLNEGIAAGRVALAESGGAGEVVGSVLINLTNPVRLHAQRTGDLSAVDDLAGLLAAALLGMAPGHPERPDMQSSLASLHFVRFERTGELDPAHRAVALFRQSAAETTAAPRVPGTLCDLSGALHVLFLRTGVPAYLDESVDVARRALTSPALDRRSEADIRSNLSASLQIRHVLTGSMQDLVDAVAEGMDALAATDEQDPSWTARLNNLGNSTRYLAAATGDDYLWEEARTLCAQAVSSSAALAPDRALCQVSYAQALVENPDPEPDAESEAAANLAAALAQRTAAPVVRVRAGRQLGQLHAVHGRWPEAAAAFADTVRCLRLMAPRYLSWDDQEHHLVRAGGLGADAAAAALFVGSRESAVEMLEESRGVVLSYQLDVEAQRLRAVAPHLADELLRVRAVMNVERNR